MIVISALGLELVSGSLPSLFVILFIGYFVFELGFFTGQRSNLTLGVGRLLCLGLIVCGHAGLMQNQTFVAVIAAEKPRRWPGS
jgi:hypothetical protein